MIAVWPRGARLDVWSDNADGFYDVQQPGIQPKWNNRGIFTTGADGAATWSQVERTVAAIVHALGEAPGRREPR